MAFFLNFDTEQLYKEIFGLIEKDPSLKLRLCYILKPRKNIFDCLRFKYDLLKIKFKKWI